MPKLGQPHLGMAEEKITMNKKGQGLTEYGIILLLVVLIGGIVWFHSDIKGQLSTIYATIASDLKSIAGGEKSQAENYDTGHTTTIGDVLLHETSLTLKDKTIYWYEKDGVKQYTNNGLGFSPFTLHFNDDGSFKLGSQHYGDVAGTYEAVFFKAGDGNIYQMTSYGNETNTLTKVTGALPYIDSDFHIVSDEEAAANHYTARVTPY